MYAVGSSLFSGICVGASLVESERYSLAQRVPNNIGSANSTCLIGRFLLPQSITGTIPLINQLFALLGKAPLLKMTYPVHLLTYGSIVGFSHIIARGIENENVREMALAIEQNFGVVCRTASLVCLVALVYLNATIYTVSALAFGTLSYFKSSLPTKLQSLMNQELRLCLDVGSLAFAPLVYKLQAMHNLYQVYQSHYGTVYNPTPLTKETALDRHQRYELNPHYLEQFRLQVEIPQDFSVDFFSDELEKAIDHLDESIEEPTQLEREWTVRLAEKFEGTPFRSIHGSIRYSDRGCPDIYLRTVREGMANYLICARNSPEIQKHLVVLKSVWEHQEPLNKLILLSELAIDGGLYNQPRLYTVARELILEVNLEARIFDAAFKKCEQKIRETVRSIYGPIIDDDRVYNTIMSLSGSSLRKMIHDDEDFQESIIEVASQQISTSDGQLWWNVWLESQNLTRSERRLLTNLHIDWIKQMMLVHFGVLAKCH